MKSRGLLASCLYPIPAIRERYRDTLLKLLGYAWNEERFLAESERVERVRWAIHPQQEGFTRALAWPRQFIFELREQILEELENGMPEVESGSSESMYFAKMSRAEGEISTQWYTDRPNDPTTVGEAKVTSDGKPVEFKELGGFATMGALWFSRTGPAEYQYRWHMGY
ncbi:MAG: hypothetical protein M2R45_00593 [Verrucomicrobia subdivision 3 bacterium]|nr:hypothetical protein [Limisphaerales bacterium]MCS1417808.1 hypothetical protein [Limisphaerales bacterium]